MLACSQVIDTQVKCLCAPILVLIQTFALWVCMPLGVVHWMNAPCTSLVGPTVRSGGRTLMLLDDSW